MWKQYLLFPFRSLQKFRSTAILQLLGFLVGLGAFIPVALVLHYHLSFDRYHAKSENIVRLSTKISLPSSTSVYAATSKSLAPLIEEQLSSVEQIARSRFVSASIRIDGKAIGEEETLFADPDFLEIFSAEPLSGNIQHALHDPNGLVITASARERFFGAENPLGRIVSVETPVGDFLLEVKAVIKDYPENVSIRYQMLASFSLIESTMRNEPGSLVPGLYTYALLAGDARGDFGQQLEALVNTHFPEGLRNIISLLAVPFSEVHYVADHQFDTGQKGSKVNNLALASLAFFLLLISIANYVNLSTALFIRRNKELVIRRIMGEGKKQQRLQLLTESLLTMLLSLVLLSILSYFVVPEVETITNLSLRTGSLSGINFYLFLFAAGLVVAALASVYPIFVSSGKKALLLAKDTRPAGWGIRYALLSAQLIVSVGFAVIALGMDEQLRFIRNKDLGFDKENVFTLGLGVEINDKADLIKQKLEQLPFVKAASISLTPISGDHIKANFGLVNDSTGSTHLVNANYVDHEFLQVYGVKLLEGRSFNRSYSSDIRLAYILNRSAIELLGFSTPAEALGQPFGKEAADSLQSGSIIGVVDDYHFLPLYRKVEPMIWQIEPAAPRNLLALRVEGGNREFQLPQLQAAIEELGITQPVEFASLSDTLGNAYSEDHRLALFIKTSTGVIIFIAMLGAFSLAAFMLETRRKELGIRKLLGAEMGQLMWLLSRSFLVCLLFGLAIGGSLAWYFLHTWLKGFAYHLQPGVWYFPVAGLATAALMLLTVFSNVSRAASTNPADVVREE